VRQVANEPWVSMRAYARHRGVSHRAVAKAIEAGRIAAVKRDERGYVVGIDLLKADGEWTRGPSAERHSHRLDLGISPPAAAKLGAFALGLLSDDSRPPEFAIASHLRDRLLAFPSRVAVELAAESDPARICEKLQCEIQSALSEVSAQLNAGTPPADWERSGQ